MQLKSRILAVTAGVVVAVGGNIGVAGGTPPGGPGGTAPVADPAFFADLKGPLTAAADGVTLSVTADSKVRTFTLTYGSHTFSGWHKHPGVVLATVTSGRVLREAGCARSTFRAGQSFTEVGKHKVWNPSSTPAVLQITHIYPTALSAVLRVDTGPENCATIAIE